VGKTLPTPYPGQSMDEYREQLVNFQNNYWSFLKPSKGGSKFIPLPPEHLNPNNKQNKTKEMSSRKLSEHVEQELFDKEKRVTVDPEKVIKTTPKIIKESVLGTSEDKPVKKKRPYYRKKYNKPTPVEDVAPKKYKNINVEPFKFISPPENQHLFIKGLLVGSVLTAIICHIIYST
jgi:hypothetical protein